MKTGRRWFLKCLSCKQPWAMDVASSLRSIPIEVTVAMSKPCPLCGHWPNYGQRGPVSHLNYSKAHKVMGYVYGETRLEILSELTPCDGRCTSAKGPNCDCSCGGKNHGSNRLVEVRTNVGPIPELT